MNWQKEHERLLDELNAVAGKTVKNFYLDTRHLSPSKMRQAVALNDLNSQAVDMYYFG